uniref:CSON011531 protein n=1 Tax=Culicoides sonorensis TaxID=179676 RepID=A0A336M7K1_CULSO
MSFKPDVHELVLAKTVDLVLERIETSCNADPNYQLTSRDLLELHSLLGVVTFRALEILDSSVIRYYTCENRAPIIWVEGIQNKPYLFYAGCNNCPCPSFKFNVKQHKTQFTCKHNLASRVAIALKKELIIEVSLPEYKKFLLQIEQSAEET